MSINGSTSFNNDHFFQFTRHLLSCNNIIDNPLNHHFEPSGTIYGIITAILFSNEEKNKEKYAFKHVYVSNLLRTWITATLLYGANGPNGPNDRLELYVCPYLKEEHKEFKIGAFKRGNYPEEISYTLIKFANFLTLLRKMYGEIGTIFEEQDKLFENGILSKFRSIYPAWYENLSNEIGIHIPNDGHFRFFKNGNYNNTDLSEIEDSIGPNTKITGFLTTGNLVEFMRWFDTQETYKKQYDENNQVYHVVTHSNIMKKYFTNDLGIRATNVIKLNLEGIHHTNLNSFRTKLHINEILQDFFKIEDGVTMDKPKSKKIENKNLENTLCAKRDESKPPVITSYELINEENKNTQEIATKIFKNFEKSQQNLNKLPRIREIQAKQNEEAVSTDSESTEPIKSSDKKNAAALKITSFLRRRTKKNKPSDDDDNIDYSIDKVEKDELENKEVKKDEVENVKKEEGVSKGGKRKSNRPMKKSKQIRRRRRTAKKQ